MRIRLSFFSRHQPLSCFPSDGCANVFVTLKVEQALAAGSPGAAFGGRKAPSSMGKMNTAGVLRLRAKSAVTRDKSVRRFAQDDDFVGVLTKNILNELALMGRGPV